MDMADILSYLSDLEAHNDREWYHAHRAEGQRAAAEFEALLQALIRRIGEFDGSVTRYAPRELTFRMTRDTRFSHDKSPYLPAFRAHIASMGKLPIPVGYYLLIRPGNRSFLGGGLFAGMFRDATRMVRDFIAENGEEWERLIAAPDFREQFAVQGEKLKKVPAGYAPDHPQAEYLKHKSWYLEYPLLDSQLVDTESFLGQAAALYRRMKPFNDLLNRALAGFQMPER